MPYPSFNWHIPLNCVFFKVLRYEDVLKQAIGCEGRCFPKLTEKIDQGLALLHLVLRNSANPCQAFWGVLSLLDTSWRELLFLLLQLVRWDNQFLVCWQVYLSLYTCRRQGADNFQHWISITFLKQQENFDHNFSKHPKGIANQISEY